MLGCLLVVVAASCTCNRQGLAGRYGEPVIASVPDDVVPSREATVALPPVVMTGSGDSAVRVRNIGNGTITFTAVAQSGGSGAFTMALPAVRELVPDEETSLPVTFAPPQDDEASLATVEHRATFAVDTDGAPPGEGRLTIEVVAQAVARDCFVASPLDFGLVPLGRAVTLPLAWDNASGLPQAPEVGALTGDDAAFFALQGAPPAVLEPGARAEVPLRFEPTVERPYRARLSVRRSAACPAVEVALTAEGSNDAVLYRPVALEFGRMPLNERQVRTVTFSNRTRSPLQLTALTVEGDGFALPDAQPRTLPDLGTAEVSVSCTPAVLGRATGALKLTLETTPPREVRVPLGCTGGGPRLHVTPRPVVSFGVVPYLSGTPITTSRRVTVSNLGTPPLAPGDVTHNLFLGRDGQPPIVSIHAAGMGTGVGEFTVSVASTWNPDAGLPAIVGQNSVDLDVRLLPRSADLKSATLSLYSTDAVEPVVTLQLTADARSTPACTLRVAPTALSFGDMPAGSMVTQTLVLTNTHATAPCTLAGIELAPGSSDAFSVAGPSTRDIAPGGSLSLPVVLQVPGGAPDGTTFNGFLRFSVNSQTTPNVLVPLGGRVAQCLVVAPASVRFGAVRLGCRSSARAINVYNACSTPVTLRSAGIVGAPGPFSVVSAPAIPPALGLQLTGGAPFSVQVAYAPVALALDTGALELRVDEAGQPRTLQVSLTGEGSANGVNTDVFVQPAQAPADLLFVIDDSCSMVDEQMSLATNFRAFLSYANQRNVPYQIGVTTTDDSPQGPQGKLLGDSSNPKLLTPSTANVEQRFASKVNVGTRGSGLEQPLSAALKAVTPPLTSSSNRGFLRPGASLSIVVVTDAADQSQEPVSYYLNRFLALAGAANAWLFSFSVIGPFSSQLPPGCSIDGFPDMGRYEPLIVATNGVKADICTNDWARDLEAIGRAALGPRSTLYLTSPADPTQPVSVTVNGSASSGWSVDPVTNALVFPSASTPPSGARVEVRYTSACY
ncbi:MAG: choice-of-anchor D domain-containing protein [Archangium sp.]|nr:choice-of-anchor D domain-containing protein [Archangium sp.]